MHSNDARSYMRQGYQNRTEATQQDNFLNHLQDKHTARLDPDAQRRYADEAQKSCEKLALFIAAMHRIPRAVVLANEPPREISAEDLRTQLFLKKRQRYFRSVIITGDILNNLLQVDLSGVDFGNCIFECDVDFSGCNLTGANFQGAIFKKKLIVKDANIQAANFRDAKIAELQTDLKTRTHGWRAKSALKKNIRTLIGKETHYISADVSITLDRSQGALKIYISNVLCDARLVWSAFCKEYGALQEKGGHGDQLARVEHVDIFEKFHTLFVHTQDDAKSRTLLAFEAIAKRSYEFAIKPMPVSMYADQSDDERAAASAESVEEASVPPEQQILAHIKAVEDQESIVRSTAIEVYTRDIQSFEIQAAQLFLHNAFGSLVNFREQRIEVILEKIAFLKAKKADCTFLGELLQSNILPAFLKLALYPDPITQLPYAQLNQVMKELPLSEALKTIVAHQISLATVRPGLFKATPQQKEGFTQNVCAEWGKLPLGTLEKLKVVDTALMARVAEKMRRYSDLVASEKTCIERQVYLSLLIEDRQYEKAQLEAQALHAAWPLVDFSQDSSLVFTNMIEAIRLSALLHIQTSMDTLDLEDVHAEDGVIKAFYAFYDAREIEQVFLKLVSPETSVPLYQRLDAAFNRIHTFSAVVIEGIQMTALMLRISKNILQDKKPVEQDDIKRLIGFIHSPFVWMASSDKKISCLQYSNCQDDSVDTAIKAILGKSIASKVLLAPNYRETLDRRVIDEHDFTALMNAMLGIDLLIDDVYKILSPIWQYEKIKLAVKIEANGTILFANSELAETRELIQHPDVNILKLTQAQTIYKAFLNFKEAIQAQHYTTLTGIQKRCIAGDVKKDRYSFQKERYTIPGLLPFAQLLQSADLSFLLDDCLLKLGDEATKKFGTSISVAARALKERKNQWQRHVNAYINFHEPSAVEHRAAFACGR